MPKPRDNFKAGLFVIVGLVLGVTVVVLLTDFRRMFEPHQKVRVVFDVVDGLRGLKDGANVTLGDEPIGKVTTIHDVVVDTAGGHHVEQMEVTLKIPSRYAVCSNAIMEIKEPLFGEGTKINIKALGNGELYADAKPIHGVIAASDQVDQLVAQMGINEPQRQNIKQILAHVDKLAASLADDVPAITGKIRDELPKMADSIQRTLAAVEKLPIKADETLQQLKEAATKANDIVSDTKTRSAVWFERIDSITDSANKSLLTVRDLLHDKDPALRETVDDALAAVKKVNDMLDQVKQKNLQQVTDALDKVNETMANLKTSSADLKAFITTQRPVLERAMANAQLTTDSLKLAAIEVRRSPWRLLYKPDDKELETDNLYDAARSFALAASLVDSSVQALKAMKERDPNDPQVQRVLDHMEKVFGRFEEAESGFWDALRGRPQPPGATTRPNHAPVP